MTMATSNISLSSIMSAALMTSMSSSVLGLGLASLTYKQCSQLWPNSANVAELDSDLAERFLFFQPLFSQPKWPNLAVGHNFLRFWLFFLKIDFF